MCKIDTVLLIYFVPDVMLNRHQIPFNSLQNILILNLDIIYWSSTAFEFSYILSMFTSKNVIEYKFWNIGLRLTVTCEKSPNIDNVNVTYLCLSPGCLFHKWKAQYKKHTGKLEVASLRLLITAPRVYSDERKKGERAIKLLDLYSGIRGIVFWDFEFS